VSLSFIEKAITRGLLHEPDLICLTGDYVTAGDQRDLEQYGRVLSQLPDHAPTFAALGNHDGGAWSQRKGGYADTTEIKALFEGAGITLLYNRWIITASRVAMVGTADLWAGGFALSSAFDGLDSNDVEATICLSHNPDSKDLMDDQAWDLMLSGHTHGGQVVVPFFGAPFAPVQDRRYVSGLNPWGDRQVYITRGVGNLYRLRLNCRPDVSILELV
jgi:predicted MPP superfamily phosphohydrolase